MGTENAVGIITILVLDFAELVPVTHEARVGFWPPFHGARFASPRSIGHQIVSQDAEEFGI